MKFENYHVFRTAVGGKLLELEIGKVCEMANGQVMVRYGDTVVNVTAVASKQPRPDIDFFPLSCDYEEKLYAAGKIPGGFIKREGRPSEKAILNSRLMDRPLRPLFPKGYFNDVQVTRFGCTGGNSRYDRLFRGIVNFRYSVGRTHRFSVDRNDRRGIHHKSHLGTEGKKRFALGSVRNKRCDYDGRGRGKRNS